MKASAGLKARLLGLACLCAPALIGIPAEAKRESLPAPQLAARNVIKGSVSAVTRIEVPPGAAIKPPGSARVITRGAGRFVGVFLVGVPYDPLETFEFIGGVARYCGRPGCGSGPSDRISHRNLFGEQTDEQGNVLIPPGAYDLYLLADGSPVTVTLKVKGLEGVQRFAPSAQVRYQVVNPPPVLFEENTRAFYSHGRTIEFGAGRAAIALDILRFQGDFWASGQYGVCLYGGRPPGPPEVNYGPACMVLGPSVGDHIVQTSPYRKLDSWFIRATPAGTYGLGHYVSAAADVSDIKGLSLNLTLR